MKRLLVLRPEPGASATALRAEKMGLLPITCPLFEIEPLEWQLPDPLAFEGLLLTSANAVRHAGEGLERVSHLPVFAVGEATADAARSAGLTVCRTGDRNVASLLAALDRPHRLLHLCGQHSVAVEGPHEIARCPVYRSAPVADPELPIAADLVAMVHSPRAGARLSELVTERSGFAIAAISEAAAEACGTGWLALSVAERPSDGALLALAARLCQDRGR